MLKGFPLDEPKQEESVCGNMNDGKVC